MNECDYIVGLMRDNYNALGFIPMTTIQSRYLAHNRYLIQSTGKQIGYLLHGAVQPGKVLSISQAVVDYDFREHGHGHDLVNRLITRATDANMRAIKLRCADDLSASLFWLSCGFTPTKTQPPSNKRHRSVTTYLYDLWPTLFTAI